MTIPTYEVRKLFGLEGTTALVTGAAGRLGGEIVSACLAAGAMVVAADLDEDSLASKAAEKGWPADQVEPVALDVRDRTQIDQAFAKGVKRFGDVNALVNNAGTNVFLPFSERTEEQFDLVTSVNLKGPFFCMQAFIALRRGREGRGSIVNISSVYGLVSPDPRVYPTDWRRDASEVYCATKAGLDAMTRYFSAFAAADGIRVNAVAPGGLRNSYSPQPEAFQRNYGERCPMGRMAEIGEIPGAVVFLLSPAASYITGQTLAVDGGYSAW